LEGERLRPIAYESCKNGFACEEVEQVEEKKQLRLLQTFLQEPELSQTDPKSRSLKFYSNVAVAGFN